MGKKKLIQLAARNQKMEESSSAGGSAPVRADTWEQPPIWSSPNPTVQNPAVIPSQQPHHHHPAPTPVSPRFIHLSKLIPERAHASGTHISISAWLCLIRLFLGVHVWVRWRLCAAMRERDYMNYVSGCGGVPTPGCSMYTELISSCHIGGGRAKAGEPHLVRVIFANKN